MIVNLPQPPVVYELRDQIEVRRLLMQVIRLQQEKLQELEARLVVLEP